MNDILDIYRNLKANGHRPALLESCGPESAFCRRSFLGHCRSRSLEVWDGRLYVDGKESGHALALFSHLNTPTGTAFFPAWIGFLSYEFARHFGFATRSPMEGIPEAAFYYYESGSEWEAPSNYVGHKEQLQLNIPLSAHDTPTEFQDAVRAIQEKIRSGWVYQVNLSRRYSFTDKHLDPAALYERLQVVNPAPFMGLLEGDNWAIVSGSPERLFKHQDGIISARPIAGTRPRGRTPDEDKALEDELCSNEKERAEHVMLVDLCRNDLAQVADPASSYMSEAFSVERYSHVMHLVSEVVGTSSAALEPMFRALFPGGTITGAPKQSVMATIAEFESTPRGPYTGSLGYISSGCGIDFNILIRSLTLASGRGVISSGAGIVIDSIPEREYAETQAKAEALRHVLGHGTRGQSPQAPRLGRPWYPAFTQPLYRRDMVFIENYDSFSYNLVDYFMRLGCKVDVLTQTDPIPSDTKHLLIGPGPGAPDDSKYLYKWIRYAEQHHIPLLGICLGHQAIGSYFGAQLVRATTPIHGKAHSICHQQDGIMSGLPNPVNFTRYHSLILNNLPACLSCSATTESGETMALRHNSLPIFGVQFHPESFLSEHGLTLLNNFLSVPLP